MALFKRKKKSEDKGKKEVKKAEEKAAEIEADKKIDKKAEEKAGERKKSMKDLYAEGDATVTTTTKEGKKVKQRRKYGNAYRIIVKPLVTEKAASLGTLNQYVFEVARDANKIEIAKAIDEVYGVKPTSVNIIKMKGKNVNYGRYTGRRRNWKKAVITLPEGKSINIYEGV